MMHLALVSFYTSVQRRQSCGRARATAAQQNSKLRVWIGIFSFRPPTPMATVNPFDLLADDDNDDPSHLIAVRQQKVASKKPHRTRGCAGEQIPEQAPPSLPQKQVFFYCS
ncbi:hypothetical protein BHM03_00047575 [Ensete ventricosum]|nr:hypothetical protein BHM03_00047575 [Ensete ventricosum]